MVKNEKYANFFSAFQNFQMNISNDGIVVTTVVIILNSNKVTFFFIYIFIIHFFREYPLILSTAV